MDLHPSGNDHQRAASAATYRPVVAAQANATVEEIRPLAPSPPLPTDSQEEQFGSSKAGRKRAKLDMSTYDPTWDVKKYSPTDPSRLLFEELENKLYTRIFCSGPGCDKGFKVRSLTGPERRDMQAVGCSRKCASGWAWRYGKKLSDLHRPCLRCPETHITNSQKRIGKRGGWPLLCCNVFRNIQRSLHEARTNETRMDEARTVEAEMNEARANESEANEAEGDEAIIYQDSTLAQSPAALVKMEPAEDEHGAWEVSDISDEVIAECANTGAGPASSVRTLLEGAWADMCQRRIDEMARARLGPSVLASTAYQGAPRMKGSHSSSIPISQLLNHSDEDDRSNVSPEWQ